MANTPNYRCTIYNARKKCLISAYQNYNRIYFSLVCRAAKIAFNVYGTMNSIVNYIKMRGSLLSRLSYTLSVPERYIFANIIECLDSVNREMRDK